VRRLLLLTNALVFLEVLFFTLLAPLLPELAARLGLSDAELGVLSGAYAWGSVLAAFPAAFLAQRFGPRPVVVAGLVTLSIASLLLAWGEQVVLLDAARFAQGISGAVVWGAAMTWILTTAPADRRGAMIGTTVAAGAAGGIVGPIMGATASVLGTPWVFTASLAITLPLILVVLLARGAPRLEHQPVRVVLATLANRQVGAAVAFLSVPALAFGATTVLVPLKIHQLGGSASLIAGVFVGAAVVEGVLGPLAGRLSDSVGRQPLYVLGLLLYAICLVVMGAGDSLGFLIGAFLSGAAGGGFFITPALAALSDVADHYDLPQSHALALSNTAFVLGLALGAVVGGVVASVGGNDTAYLVMAALLFVVAGWGSRAALPRPLIPTP
jgi:MFS family permease